MKKALVIVGTVILSLIITFLFAETCSLYHFGDVPTFRTSAYLITIFFIIEYVLLVISYVISKKLVKEKIGLMKIISMILFFIALILIFGFVIILDIDWLNHYLDSGPFYLNVILRSLEFLLPAVIFMGFGIFTLKMKK